MQTSFFLQIIENGNGWALCYHALLGNMFLLEPEYLKQLKRLKAENINSKVCSKDLILQELRDANFLEEYELEAYDILARKNREWLRLFSSGGRLKLLNLVISEACNLGCQHCLHRCSVKNYETHGSKKFMDWPTAKLAIDNYTKVIRRFDSSAKLSVHFGSAEPLLNWEVMRRSCEYVRQIDSIADLAVNTNLILVTDEMAKFFVDFGVKVSISLDGPIDGNDAIRIYPSGKGTYRDILVAIATMRRAGYDIDAFSVTINDLNFDSIDENFVDWAAKEGFRGIATDIDLINARNAKRSIKKCIQKLIDIRTACLKHGLENFGSWTTVYDYLVNEPDCGVTTFCRAASGQNISVNPEGKLFICGHTNSLLGLLDDFENVFIIGSPYFKLVESRLPGNNPMCYGCSIEGFCAGQCHITKEMAVATGNGHFDYLCEFYRQATRRMLEIKLEAELRDIAVQ